MYLLASKKLAKNYANVKLLKLAWINTTQKHAAGSTDIEIIWVSHMKTVELGRLYDQNEK